MDDVCYLVKEAISHDEYGRTVTTQTRRQMFSVIRSYRDSEKIGDAVELILERKVGTMGAGESE